MHFDEKRVSVLATGLAILLALAVGFFAALGVRSVVAGPGLAPSAAPPNPGHSWSQIGDFPGTIWHSNNDGAGTGLDADTVDGLHASDMGGSTLGQWESKTRGTIYQAATDGFVTAFNVSNVLLSPWIEGLTDSNNPPTTLRTRVSLGGSNGIRSSITFPVREGDYWQVKASEGSDTFVVYWIPFGP